MWKEEQSVEQRSQYRYPDKIACRLSSPCINSQHGTSEYTGEC